MLKKVLFPLLFLVLAYFVFSFESAKEIIAGIAIFLVGMFFLEEGFRLFSGGFLEKILEKFTNTLGKGILNGFLITSVVQSSSITSVILISFLGAGLIGLESAISVLLGSSLGSSTTAWIISLFGLKIKISHYAMPIIIFGIVFRFSKNQRYKGFGNILLGLGFVFLGISYMVNGFFDLKESVDLSVYSSNSFWMMVLFGLIGAFMTFVVQSSSASIAIILTALASSQVLYFNAIALVIGGKIGSTATTVIGSMSSNSNGKRLALFQFILNLIATIFGIILFYPIVSLIDLIADYFVIESDVIKLTLFVTIFNLMAVIIVIPVLKKIIPILNKMFVPKVKSWSKLEFVDSEILESSKSIIVGLKKENMVLYNKLLKAIKHQLLINDEHIYWTKKYENKKVPQNVKIDKIYKEKIKALHDEIIDFMSFAQKDMNSNDLKELGSLKTTTNHIYSSLKDIRNLNKNIEDYNTGNKNLFEQYKLIKEIMSITIKELEIIYQNTNMDDIDKIFKVKNLQQKLIFLDNVSNSGVDKLYEDKKIDAKMATKIIKDISFAVLICQQLIDITISLVIEDKLLIEVEEDDENW